VNGVEDLPPHLDWEALLRAGSFAGSLIVGMCLGREGAVAACVPYRVRAGRRLLHSREDSEITAPRPHCHTIRIKTAMEAREPRGRAGDDHGGMASSARLSLLPPP
jgi:hypothetical protein